MENRQKINALRKEFLKEYENKDFFSATETLEKIIKLYKKIDDEVEYCSDLYNLGLLYQKSERYALAQKIYKKILKTLENKQFNPENTKDCQKLEILIDTFISDGICYAKLNYNSHAALNSFETALKMTKKYLPKKAKKISKILHNIGTIHYEKRRYDDAIYYHLESLALKKEKDLDYVDNLNFLGYSYEHIENYENAIGYLAQALEIIKGLKGISSKEYLSNLYYLGSVYFKAKDYKNCIKVYTKASELIKEKLTENHPYFPEILMKIADCYLEMKNYKDALDIQLKATNIIKKTVGDNHAFYADALANLAEIFFNLGDLEKAVSYHQKELKIKKEILGNKNVEYINSLLNFIERVLAFNTKISVKQMQEELFDLYNLELNKKCFKKILLILCKIYIKFDKVKLLEDVLECYTKIVPNATFSTMLNDAAELKEIFVYKEEFYFENEVAENDYVGSFREVESRIFDGIKNVFEGIKKQIEDENEDDDENNEKV